jgi:hypothetical protein
MESLLQVGIRSAASVTGLSTTHLSSISTAPETVRKRNPLSTVGPGKASFRRFLDILPRLKSWDSYGFHD